MPGSTEADEMDFFDEFCEQHREEYAGKALWALDNVRGVMELEAEEGNAFSWDLQLDRLEPPPPNSDPGLLIAIAACGILLELHDVMHDDFDVCVGEDILDIIDHQKGHCLAALTGIGR